MIRSAIDNLQKVINDSEQMEIFVGQIKKAKGIEDEEMVAEYEAKKREA